MTCGKNEARAEAATELCTCSHTPVNSTTIDPPDLILDPWCPVHGKDPDQEYEQHRDDAEWDRQYGCDLDDEP